MDEKKTYIKCADCGKLIPEMQNRVRCNRCQKKFKKIYNAHYSKNRRETYRLLGLCTWCGGNVENGAIMCPSCQEKYNKRRRGQKRKESNETLAKET